MDILDAIRTRRSIRKFKDRKVPEEIVNAILSAAMMAPTAGNAQTWHFVVLDKPDLLAKVLEAPLYDNITKPVPMGILVCAEPALEKSAGFWPQDAAAAAENILLAAHDLGLGAVWTAVYPMEDRVHALRSALSIPGDIEPVALLLMGYPDEELPPEDRYQESRVRWNLWEGN